MKQRNSLFAGIALVVAGAAIGAGAIVSSNAMADNDTSDSANSVQVVSVASDGGEAISCTFDDIALPMLVDPAAADAAGSSTQAQGVTGVVPVAGQVVEGTVSGDASSTDPGSGVAVEVATDVLPPAAQLVSTAPAREGTPDECAAIRATFDIAP